MDAVSSSNAASHPAWRCAARRDCPVACPSGRRHGRRVRRDLQPAQGGRPDHHGRADRRGTEARMPVGTAGRADALRRIQMWTFERFSANYPVFERFAVRLKFFRVRGDFSAGRGFVERFSADGPAFERFAVTTERFSVSEGVFRPAKGWIERFSASSHIFERFSGNLNGLPRTCRILNVSPSC